MDILAQTLVFHPFFRVFHVYLMSILHYCNHFFSNLCDVKACTFVTHELFHLDVLLDNLFYIPYKLKSNLHVHFW